MENAKLNKRVEWIDVLKGIGIILVVLGHNQVTKYAGTYISSIHMPLFLLISGYLYDSKKYSKFINFLESRFKGIIIPFLFFTLISLFTYMGLSMIRGEVIEWSKVIRQFIISGVTPLNLPLWFLKTLFVVELMFYFLKKYSKNNIILFVCLAIFLMISFNNHLFGLDFEVTRTFNALFFYGLGNLLRGKKIDFKYKIFILLLTLVVSNIIVAKSVNINLYLAISLTDHFMYFFLAACSGITSCYILARFINKSKILEYFGKNSLIVLGMHMLIKIFTSYFWVYILRAPRNMLNSKSNLSALLYTVVILLLCVPVIEIYNKYFGKVFTKINFSKQHASAEEKSLSN